MSDFVPQQLDFYDRSYETQEGMYYMSFRAISNSVNLNYDGWPSEELKKAYKTFVGKPVYVDHHSDDESRARGIILDSEYVENGEDKFIALLIEIDALAFPMLAEELRTGGIDSVSMGAIVGKSECSICGTDVATGETCQHIPSMKGKYIGDQLVYEICKDIEFYEISLVFEPADVTALAKNIVVASTQKSSQAYMKYEPETERFDLRERSFFGFGGDEPVEAFPLSYTNEEESDDIDIFKINPFATVEVRDPSFETFDMSDYIEDMSDLEELL